MSEIENTYYTGPEKRKSPCPAVQQIVDLAAERGAIAVFKRIGYDLDDPKDVKKLTLIFDFMETLSGNVKKGKIIVGSTALKLVVTAIVGASVLKYFNYKR